MKITLSNMLRGAMKTEWRFGKRRLKSIYDAKCGHHKGGKEKI